MGTRGFITFVAEGVEKTAYNHFDSYPSGLGETVLLWLRKQDDLSALRAKVTALRVVDRESKPSVTDIERLKGYANTSVSRGRLDEWYVLLRGTQGDPEAMLDAGVIEDASDFPADSLFAEWGYVIDLDAEAFEVYEGFQRGEHERGRFASREGSDGYAPVALVKSYPLSELPSIEAFLFDLNDGADGDD